MSEEEDMELSGECNIVSNLHNFSFDVSWSNHNTSPPRQRHSNTYVSPARFLAASTPNTTNWKSLTLKERPVNHQTVKVSQKTVPLYLPSESRKSSDTRSLSPMDFDHTESSSDFRNSCSNLRKRHSDFGISYNSNKPKDVHKMKEICERSLVTSRSVENTVGNESNLEDSVFLRNTPKLTQRKVGGCLQNMNYDKCSGRRPDTPDSLAQSSFLVLLIVVVVSSSVGIYFYFQMEWCAVFDVDTVKLQHKLEDNVFGQHIAVKTVIEALETFKDNIKNKNGKRSLVMSFHGWTGIGKNFVSKFIAEAFYNAKVSLYVGPLHLVERYQSDNPKGNDDVNKTANIKDWILKNVTKCGVNVVIVDEIDKAEKDNLVGIQAAIESLNKKSEIKTNNGVKFGPISVFLFLSNSRASQINHYLFSQLLKERDRKLVRKSEFDDIFEEGKSEWYASMKTEGLIDFFVPFLPLTEFHVRQCIERDFIKKGRDPSQSLIMAVMEELSFVDMGGKSGQISLTGCKRVSDKVDLHLDD